jgi:hypothetical protein
VKHSKIVRKARNIYIQKILGKRGHISILVKNLESLMKSVVEGLFKKGAIVIVDDILSADKGRILKPYLDRSADWETKTHNIESGTLVATKIT